MKENKDVLSLDGKLTDNGETLHLFDKQSFASVNTAPPDLKNIDYILGGGIKHFIRTSAANILN